MAVSYGSGIKNKTVPLKSESEVAQSCSTLCDRVDCSPPGSSVHGILQARILEWVAISFSRGSHQAPQSMGFSRQGYWSGLPFPSPGDLPDPGIKPRPPSLQADALTSEPPRKLKSRDF